MISELAIDLFDWCLKVTFYTVAIILVALVWAAIGIVIYEVLTVV